MSKASPITVVAFGDSITAATTELPDAAQRWPTLLEAMLRIRFPKTILNVINAGVGGNTSREGLARMDRDVLSHAPDCVLVQFGGNDATPEPDRRVALDEYAANIEKMKVRIDALGHCRMILLTFPPVIDRQHAWWVEAFRDIGGQDAFVEQYRKATREFAVRYALPLVDLDYAIRRNPAAYILPDGVHLTATGNRVVAEAVLPVISAVLEELRR